MYIYVYVYIDIYTSSDASARALFRKYGGSSNANAGASEAISPTRESNLGGFGPNRLGRSVYGPYPPLLL